MGQNLRGEDTPGFLKEISMDKTEKEEDFQPAIL